jgi:hypothetical protein
MMLWLLAGTMCRWGQPGAITPSPWPRWPADGQAGRGQSWCAPLSGIRVPASSRGHSGRGRTSDSSPALSSPGARSTRERGVLMALSGRTSRSHGINRVSSGIWARFPGRAGQTGIARLLRSGARPERPGFTVAVTVRRRPCPPPAAELAWSALREPGATGAPGDGLHVPDWAGVAADAGRPESVAHRGPVPR